MLERLNHILLFVMAVLTGFLIGLVINPIFGTTAYHELVDAKDPYISGVSCGSDSMGLVVPCGAKLHGHLLYDDEPLEMGQLYIYQDGPGMTIHRLVGCVDDDCEQVIFKGDNNLVIDDFVSRDDILYRVTMVER